MKLRIMACLPRLNRIVRPDRPLRNPMSRQQTDFFAIQVSLLPHLRGNVTMPFTPGCSKQNLAKKAMDVDGLPILGKWLCFSCIS